MSNTTMYYEWVIGRYDVSTKRGKFILESGNDGLGYIILSKPTGRVGDIIVAFKRPLASPRPDYLDLATPQQVEKFDAIEEKRHRKS